MGLRLVLLTALVAALAAAVVVAGCSSRLHDAGDRPRGLVTGQPSMQPSISEPTPSAQPYADTAAEVHDLCVSFVQAALAYDSTTEARDAFLGRLAPLTAPAALLELRRSQRA